MAFVVLLAAALMGAASTTPDGVVEPWHLAEVMKGFCHVDGRLRCWAKIDVELPVGGELEAGFFLVWRDCEDRELFGHPCRLQLRGFGIEIWDWDMNGLDTRDDGQSGPRPHFGSGAVETQEGLEESPLWLEDFALGRLRAGNGEFVRTERVLLRASRREEQLEAEAMYDAILLAIYSALDSGALLAKLERRRYCFNPVGREVVCADP